jgi:hypothetical protein
MESSSGADGEVVRVDPVVGGDDGNGLLCIGETSTTQILVLKLDRVAHGHLTGVVEL